MTNQFQVTKTAAEAVVGADLFQGEKFATATYGRKLASIAVVGSAAIADFAVELWAGEARKGLFLNSSAGAAIVPKKEDQKFPGALVPANSQLMCKVTDAAATNPVVIEVKFDSARSRSGFGGTRRSYFAGYGARAWRATSRYPTRDAWLASRR